MYYCGDVRCLSGEQIWHWQCFRSICWHKQTYTNRERERASDEVSRHRPAVRGTNAVTMIPLMLVQQQQNKSNKKNQFNEAKRMNRFLSREMIHILRCFSFRESIWIEMLITLFIYRSLITSVYRMDLCTCVNVTHTVYYMRIELEHESARINYQW